MRLYEFLEYFDFKTKIRVLDEDGAILYENVVSEITQGIMNRRDVIKAYIGNTTLEIVTTYEKEFMDIDFTN